MKPVLEVVTEGRRAASCRVFRVHLTRKPSHWHYHPELELTLVLTGEGTRLVGDHVGRFAAGDLMLTGENLPHDFNVAAHEAADFLVIQFRPDLVDAYVEMAPLARMFDRARRGILFERGSPAFAEALLSIVEQTPARQLMGVLELLTSLSERDDGRELCGETFAPAQLAGGPLSRLNQVIDFVSTNYERSIALSDMTALTSMTAPSFCRWFRKTMDVSFLTYVNHHRVEHATRLLLATDRPINAIARDSGFDSISSFNRAFRRRTGAAPREFRRRAGG